MCDECSYPYNELGTVLSNGWKVLRVGADDRDAPIHNLPPRWHAGDCVLCDPYGTFVLAFPERLLIADPCWGMNEEQQEEFYKQHGTDVDEPFIRARREFEPLCRLSAYDGYHLYCDALEHAWYHRNQHGAFDAWLLNRMARSVQHASSERHP